MKKLLIVLLIALLAVFLNSCTDYYAQIEQLTKQNEQLKEEVEYVRENNQDLSLKISDYRQQLNRLKNELEEIKPGENKVIIPTGLDLEVLEVLLTYFEGVNENDKDRIRSVIKVGNSNEEAILNWGNLNRRNLVKVDSFNEGDVGRPQYIMNVSYFSNDKKNSRMFVLQKFEAGWKIVDID